MKWPTLKRREFILFVITLLGGLFFILKAYVIEPLLDWDRRLSKQIRKELLIEGKNDFILSRLSAIQENFKWVMSKYGRTKNDAQELGVMVNDIETLAKKMDIFIVQMQPRKPIKEEIYIEYLVDLSFQANWNELMAFLSKIEATPFHYRIQGMKIENTRQANRKLKGTLVILNERFDMSREE